MVDMLYYLGHAFYISVSLGCVDVDVGMMCGIALITELCLTCCNRHRAACLQVVQVWKGRQNRQSTLALTKEQVYPTQTRGSLMPPLSLHCCNDEVAPGAT